MSLVPLPPPPAPHRLPTLPRPERDSVHLVHFVPDESRHAEGRQLLTPFYAALRKMGINVMMEMVVSVCVGGW